MSYCLNPNCNHQNSQEAVTCQHCNSVLSIDNRYRAIKVLGQGGFGKTFLGIDRAYPNLPRCVIKQLLPANHNQSEKAQQQFQQEAIRLQKLGQLDLIDLNNAWIWQQYLVNNYVSASLVNLLNKMICFSLSQRYQTAADIIKDFHNYSIQSNESKRKIFQSIVLITLITIGIVSLSILQTAKNLTFPN